MVVIPLLQIHKNVFVRIDSRYTGLADRAAWRWWPKSAMTILTDPEPSDLPEETLIVRNLPEGFEIEGRTAFPMTIRKWRFNKLATYVH